MTVLEDDFALTREETDTVDERRFVTLGLSNLANLPRDLAVEGEHAPEGIL